MVNPLRNATHAIVFMHNNRKKSWNEPGKSFKKNQKTFKV